MPEINSIIAPTPDQVLRAQANATDVARNLAHTITGVSGPDQGVIREIIPSADLASGAGNNWADSDRDWVQGGLAADSLQETYTISSTGAAENKVLVFYGMYNVASDVLTTEVVFEDGTGAAFARFNAESLEIAEVGDFILFDEPIVYGATEDGSLNQWPDAAGTDHLVYMVRVAEPIGNTVTQRQPTEQRLAGR